MKDIKWERKTVTLEVESSTSKATLELNVSIPEGGCECLKYSRDTGGFQTVSTFVNDALEVPLNSVTEWMINDSFENDNCLSSHLGDAIEDGFVECQGVTGMVIMFRSLKCTALDYKPHATYRLTETKVWE